TTCFPRNCFSFPRARVRCPLSLPTSPLRKHPLTTVHFSHTSRLAFHAVGAKRYAAMPAAIAMRFLSTVHWESDDWNKRPEWVSRGNLMFERYTDKARRVIFFARYEASQYGSPYIETEHLLLGLLREDRALASRFLDKVN